MIQHDLKVLAVCLLLLGSTACKTSDGSSHSLLNLQKLSPGSGKSAVGPIRTQALRDTALSVGARGGLAWRSSKINGVLVQNQSLLYRIFNFNAMLLDKNVLPPILTEARNTLSLGGTDTIRIADRTYQILNQARFVSAPPTWRDYLWLSFGPPESPDRTLLPRTAVERLIWKKYTAEGWRAGVQQADLIFKENMSRLQRDFEGMIRYRTLLAQQMVSPPYVAETDMGITGGGTDLTVSDRILRITAFPTLQNDSQNWKTEIIPHE